MNGFLILDKPTGRSSHAMVSLVRRTTGVKRVGHAGTLDPLATGVLVICLGQAVRLSEYLIDHDKRYRAVIRLGVETDTYDATGQIVAEHPVQVSPDDIQRALLSFVGPQQQMPPAHSAIQRAGVRAYKLARQGIQVELEPRAVTIYSIELVGVREAEVEIEVHCSKGTYIRSIAHDLGQRLGTGGHLSALRRLAVGQFTLQESITPEALEAAMAAGELVHHLIPMDRAVLHFDAVQLSRADADAILHGRFLPAPANLTTDLVRAYDEQGQLIALLEKSTSNLLKPKKVLGPDNA